MTDTVVCGACHGTGRVPLDTEHAAVLREMRRRRGDVSAVDLLARFPGVQNTAMCNRLARLERAGFLVRVAKRGRRVYFRAVRSVTGKPAR